MFTGALSGKAASVACMSTSYSWATISTPTLSS